jgi:hypothetical protein
MIAAACAVGRSPRHAPSVDDRLSFSFSMTRNLGVDA